MNTTAQIIISNYDASRPFAVLFSKRIVGRYETKAAAQRRVRALKGA